PRRGRPGRRRPSDRADHVDADPRSRPRRGLPPRRLCLAEGATTELKPVYLITGGDRPKIHRALRRLRDRIGEEGVELLSANDARGEDVGAACNYMGVLWG